MGRSKERIKRGLLNKIFLTRIPLLIFYIVAIVGFFLYNHVYNQGVNDERARAEKIAMEEAAKARPTLSVSFIEKVQQVVFLNVGIKDIVPVREASKILGFEIPFTEKRKLVILNYEAKFGIKSPVTVETPDENTVIIKVPEFSVIGFNFSEENPYELYSSDAELLSLFTTDIDTGKVLTDQLSSEFENRYLERYTELIKESAKNYYENLIQGIKPDAEVQIEFSN